MSGLFLLDTKVRDFSENRTISTPKKCKSGASLQKRLPHPVSVANRHKAYSS